MPFSLHFDIVYLYQFITLILSASLHQTGLKATPGKGLQEEQLLNVTKQKHLERKVEFDAPLITVQIVGWKKTCTRQGIPKR